MNKRSLEEKLALAKALINRKYPTEEAIERLRKLYPRAPETVLSTMAHHLYTDGAEALLDMLCGLELFLRGEDKEINLGNIFHLEYHLYCFRLLDSLMPWTTSDVIEEIEEVEKALDGEEPDVEWAKKQLDWIRSVIEGHASPPSEI